MGGGFCDLHGPFDPPHVVCPYCIVENDQRRAFGPPSSDVRPVTPPPTNGDFVRRVVESPPTDVTEIIPRRASEQGLAAAESLLGWLIVKEPAERRGMLIAIRANQTIGRDGDARWNDPRLSRQHARVTVEPPDDDPDGTPTFHIWPFGPTNPVYINGREIRGATPIYENDEIRLGDTLFVLKVL
jgi:pSer/pThr/pTyr-binding forkhead associated (FHA) protein